MGTAVETTSQGYGGEMKLIIGFLPATSLLLLFFSLYIFLYIFFSERYENKKNKLYYGAFVDGEFIFLFFIILIADILI